MSDEIKKLQSELHSIQQQFSSIKKAYDSLQLSFAQIEMVYEFAATLNTSVTLEDLLKIIKTKFKETYNIDAYALLLKNKQTSIFRTISSYNISVKAIKENSGSHTALFKLVSETRKYRLISKTENRFGFMKKAGSLLCIPLQNKNKETFAILLLQTNDKEEFDVKEIEFFLRISMHIASTLDNILRYEHFKELSFKDELTGLHNRRYFFQRFEIEEQRSNRYKRPIAVLMLDIDHFKIYNDLNGHLKGDELLRRVASKLQQILRKPDILARYGGEEFIVLLPETSKTQARKAAEKLRKKIETERFDSEDTQPLGRITVSIGVSAFPDDTDVPQDLIKMADKALYSAKHKGRNRVVWLTEEKKNLKSI